mmetsp:Transcript_11074/g.26733  ORF Transcript_11074/g.26733 Transcript_11074/m.26733 type:complete len:686 (-) Transcript_11074:1057-3114(-)|eukprot:CAMPEP_0113610608 /NCGR_PEP_ID=MMETSP0017_2-20120614/5117_1 /TAXON_ID=2856 /ORGANISM="Cylindrotheca closterium" /LENGTH=685 /DNA_ID=CAMNT_0000519507 /DNA_START=135 /DNA_END=2192 /DNA_ORIENTATION=+ /assembly_acc=CAM_ASM_000147
MLTSREFNKGNRISATKPRRRQQQSLGTLLCLFGFIFPFSSTFQITSVNPSRQTPYLPSRHRQESQVQFTPSNCHQPVQLKNKKPSSLLSATPRYSNDDIGEIIESDFLEDEEDDPTMSLFWPSPAGDPNLVDGDIDEDNEERMQQQQHQNRVFDSIIKIYATHKEPDLIMPWQSKHPVSSTSSGFVIEGNRIMTNAHSVEYATMIQVQKRGDPTKYRAVVEEIANECDLAILNVLEQEIDDDDDDDELNLSMDISLNGSSDENNGNEVMKNDENNGSESHKEEAKRQNMEFWAGLDDHPLPFGSLPELQEEVEVIGYPQGGNGLSITSGVVSRVELQEYAQSGMNLLAIQIDAAINSGNSGGPVLNEDGQIVGVAFQSLEQAENIGYVVPVTIVQHVLEDVKRNGKYTGFCRLGARFAYLENPSIREYLNLPKDYRGKGVMVRECYPTCVSKDFLKPHDVIMSVDGIPVAQNGNIPFRQGERVSLMSYIQTKFIGDKVDLEVWRKDDGENEPGLQKIEVPVSPYVSLVPQHWDNQTPPYLIMAGFVFAPLSIPYLEACDAWGDYISSSISSLLGYVRKSQQEEGEEVVILVQVLAHPLNLGYDELCDIQLKTFNNVKVKSLKHLNELIEACRKEPDNGENEFVKLEFGQTGNLVILKRSAIPLATRQICKQFSIRKPYFDARML